MFQRVCAIISVAPNRVLHLQRGGKASLVTSRPAHSFSHRLLLYKCSSRRRLVKQDGKCSIGARMNEHGLLRLGR